MYEARAGSKPNERLETGRRPPPIFPIREAMQPTQVRFGPLQSRLPGGRQTVASLDALTDVKPLTREVWRIQEDARQKAQSLQPLLRGVSRVFDHLRG